MRATLLVLACLAGVPTWANPAAAPASFRKAFEANQQTVVEVVGPKRKGPGVIVGTRGQIVTSVSYVGLHQAKVRMLGKELPARVLFADGRLKFAVVEIEWDGELPAAAARVDSTFAARTWLLGIIGGGKRAPKPAVGRIVRGPSEKSPFVLTDFAVPPGSPLFDDRGRLVAVAVSRAGNQSRALPLAAVQRLFAAGAAP